MKNHLSYFEKYTDEAVKWVTTTARAQVRRNEDEKNRTQNSNNSTNNGNGNGQGQGNTGTSGAGSLRPSNIVIDGARGTWGLCGFVVVGTLFFLSL